MSRIGILVLIALVLIGCAGAPRRPAAGQDALLLAQAAREAELAQRTNWRLSGRIAVSDGRDGGSGQIAWTQRGDRYEIALNAPVTRRSWRLVGEPGYARLEGIDGGPFIGDSAEALLQEHLAWVIPLRDLAAWVRGIRAPGAAAIRFAASGLPEQMAQGGWTIDYRNFDQGLDPAMPSRVFAAQGARRVRLQVSDWSFAPGSP